MVLTVIFILILGIKINGQNMDGMIVKQADTVLRQQHKELNGASISNVQMLNMTASYVNVTYVGVGGKMYSGLVHVQPKMNYSQVMRFVNWDRREGVGSQGISGIGSRREQNGTNIGERTFGNVGERNINFISAATNQLISPSTIPFTTQQPNIIPYPTFTSPHTPPRVVSPFFNASPFQNPIVNQTSKPSNITKHSLSLVSTQCASTSNGLCTQCLFRAVLASGKCFAVSDNCQTWNNLTGACTTCFVGLSFTNGVCQ